MNGREESSNRCGVRRPECGVRNLVIRVPGSIANPFAGLRTPHSARKSSPMELNFLIFERLGHVERFDQFSCKTPPAEYCLGDATVAH